MSIRSCRVIITAGLAGAVLLMLAGCKEPGMIGRFRATPVTNVILENLGVVDEEPEIFAGARDPVPRDLLVLETEYVIYPGDIVDISIFELFYESQDFPIRRQVSQTGRITLPILGTFLAAGQTELELTETIINRLRPRFIKEPTVSVVVTGPTKKIYSVSGAVPAPGPYQLTQSDFRLSQALANAGGIPQASADYAFVIRNVATEDVEISQGEMSLQEIKRPSTIKPGNEQSLRPTVMPSERLGPPEAEKKAEPPSTLPRTPQREQEELLESVKPMTDIIMPVELGDPADLLEKTEPDGVVVDQEDANGVDLSVPAGFEEVTGEQKEQVKPLKVIRVGNRFKLVPAEGKFVEEPQLPKEPTEPQEPNIIPIKPKPPSEPLKREYEWEKAEPRRPEAPGRGGGFEELAEGQIKESIRINLKKLRGGDYTQNIAIRPGDDIQIPFNATGIFSVMGQVARPGVFSLTGQRLTLKQAIAAAGPLTPLAEPSRCEIIRRIGENQEVTYRVNLEKLFAGMSPDVFLKPNDIINVGSHPAARWMAVVRQSFRSTYGFGFVYDRNFADKDFGH